MTSISERALAIPASTLHAVHRAVEGLEVTRPIIKLHVGEPGFAPPPGVATAIAAALRDGRTGYTSAEGLVQLRERIAAELEARHGHRAHPEQIVVTPGSTQAVLAVMLATCASGDEVLLPEIHWPIYAQAAVVAGVRPRFYRLAPDAGIDPALVMAAVSPKTRLLVVNSPANPTGVICPAEVLRILIALAQERGLWLLSDEAYQDFAYEGTHHSVAIEEQAFAVERPCVFTVHTFSKSYAMTGLRLGFVVAPGRDAAAAIVRIQEGSIVAPATPVQWAGIAALDDRAFIAEVRRRLQVTRDAALEPVHESLVPFPVAGWYTLVSVAGTGLTSEAFAETLLANHGVSVAPGSAFVPRGRVDPGFVRVAFCGDRATVVEGVRRLDEQLRELRAQPRQAAERN